MSARPMPREEGVIRSQGEGMACRIAAVEIRRKVQMTSAADGGERRRGILLPVNTQ